LTPPRVLPTIPATAARRRKRAAPRIARDRFGRLPIAGRPLPCSAGPSAPPGRA